MTLRWRVGRTYSSDVAFQGLTCANHSFAGDATSSFRNASVLSDGRSTTRAPARPAAFRSRCSRGFGCEFSSPTSTCFRATQPCRARGCAVQESPKTLGGPSLPRGEGPPRNLPVVLPAARCRTRVVEEASGPAELAESGPKNADAVYRQTCRLGTAIRTAPRCRARGRAVPPHRRRARSAGC